MKTQLSRIFALVMVLCMLCSIMAVPAFAATEGTATIDTTKKASLTLYKYDFTNAAKDGVWSTESYVSTGLYDGNVNTILGQAIRKGDTDSASDLDANGTSNGYAIKGVEFTYVRVADIVTYSEVENDMNMTLVLYGIKKTETALLNALALTAEDAYVTADGADNIDSANYYFTSLVLNKALQDALANNTIATKNALEAYAKAKGTAMPLTDENGYSAVEDLDLGLYLLVETKVPEMVIDTTAPFFVSLPMTTVNGGGNGDAGNDTVIDNGGQEWLYDVTVYPKNETGIVTLDKSVAESEDGNFDHNATASAGDKIDYQIVSTLPNITSASTYLTVYTFTDVLSRGLTYDDATPVKIEFFTKDDCTGTPVATWMPDDATPKFTVTRTVNADKTTTMVVAMTEAGLAEINPELANHTLRISYSCYLNSDESVVFGDAGNPNEVVLTWSRTSSNYYDTLIDDTHVYTYGINLAKLFADGKNDKNMFEKVNFIVKNVSDERGPWYVIAELNEEEGIWYVTGNTTEEANATVFYPVTWNNLPGQLVIKGLEDDTYVMTEIATADGYLLLKDSITIVITAEEDESRPCDVFDEDALGVIQNDPRYSFDGGLDLKLANIPQSQYDLYYVSASATVDGNPVNMKNDDMDADSTNALVPLSVTNEPGFKLPQTGETGAKWLPIIGGTIIGTSSMLLAFFLFMQRRKEEDIA